MATISLNILLGFFLLIYLLEGVAAKDAACRQDARLMGCILASIWGIFILAGLFIK